jgi:hypothetical protein
VFFHLGLQHKFPGEKNMRWQRKNMAISGIMKSFDPMKIFILFMLQPLVKGLQEETH